MVTRIPIDDDVFLDARGGHGKLNVRHSVKQSGVGDPLAACASGIRLPFAPDAGRRAFFRMSSMKKPMPNRRVLCRLVFFCIFPGRLFFGFISRFFRNLLRRFFGFRLVVFRFLFRLFLRLLGRFFCRLLSGVFFRLLRGFCCGFFRGLFCRLFSRFFRRLFGGLLHGFFRRFFGRLFRGFIRGMLCRFFGRRRRFFSFLAFAGFRRVGIFGR